MRSLMASFALVSCTILLSSCQQPGFGPYGYAYPPQGYEYAPSDALYGQQAAAQLPYDRANGSGVTRWTRSGTRGSMDSMTLTPIGGGQYQVVLSGRSGDCLASFEGVAVERRGVLQVRQGSDADRDNMCHISIRRSGNAATVKESMCTPFHGVSCSFDGTLRRVAAR